MREYNRHIIFHMFTDAINTIYDKGTEDARALMN